MARILIIIGFLFTFVMAVYAFISRETSSIRTRIKPTEEPRLLLEQFIYHRYTDNENTVQLSGRAAHFVEPNKVEIFSDVDGFRKVGDEFHELSCQLVTLHFVGNGLADVLATNELVRAEFDSQVEIRMSQQMVRTDYAEYLAQRQLLRSAQPVTITGRARELQSNSGFVYDVLNDNLRLHGQVTGVLQLDE